MLKKVPHSGKLRKNVVVLQALVKDIDNDHMQDTLMLKLIAN